MVGIIEIMTTRPTSTPRADLVTLILGAWLMIGLFLDGYAHSQIIEELESFWTPWHAVFYSGFVATSGWILWVVASHMKPGSSLRAVIPGGYGWSLAGVAAFAVGGVGDAIWHTVFGIEAGVDALLSPTHLLLFVGIFLIMSTPIRTIAWRSDRHEVGRTEAVALTLAITFMTALVGFFFQYLWAPGFAWIPQQPFDAVSGSGEFQVAFGIGAIMVANLIMFSPIAYISARWRVPIGTGTVALVVSNALIALAFDFWWEGAVVVGLAGGVVTDAVLFAGAGGATARRVALALGPLAAWSTYFWRVGSEWGLAWPPEIWGGAIVFAALAGLVLAQMSSPESSRIQPVQELESINVS